MSRSRCATRSRTPRLIFVTRRKCDIVYDDKCHDTPKDECSQKQIPVVRTTFEKCKFVTEKQCTHVTEKECTTITEKQCVDHHH